MPVAMRKVMPYWTFAFLILAMAAYPTIATGRVNSMTTPRSLRRSETKATTTEKLAREQVCKSRGMKVLTRQDSSHSIWNNRPQLDFIGVFGKVQAFDDGW